MKRRVIFSLFLLFLLILCSFTSVNAADMTSVNAADTNDLTDGLDQDNNVNIHETILNDATIDEKASNESNFILETDVKNNSDSGMDEDEGNLLDDGSDTEEILIITNGSEQTAISTQFEDNGSLSSTSSNANPNDLGDVNDLSFTDLNTLVQDGLLFGRVDLLSNYTFNRLTDEPYAAGISIIPQVWTTIDGHGHYIDGAMQAAIFKVFSNPNDVDGIVTFKNIIFRNVGWSDDMRDCYRNLAPDGDINRLRDIFNVVRVVKSNVAFDNCTFLNNNCPLNAPISCSNKGEITVDHCNFTSNTASVGGAITLSSAYTGRISNSIFTSNNAKEIGGAINILSTLTYVKDPLLTIRNCSFNENTAGSYGGAINLEEDSEYTLKIENSKFYLNNAEDGGAVYAMSNTEVSGSNFTMNYARGTAGALYLGYIDSHSQRHEPEFSGFHHNWLDNNNAVSQATDLYMIFQDGMEYYTIKQNYFNTAQSIIPSFVFDSVSYDLRFFVENNTFLPKIQMYENVYIKVKGMFQNRFQENWWGINGPVNNPYLKMELDGRVGAIIDNRPLYIRIIEPGLMHVNEETEIHISVRTGNSGNYDVMDYMPIGMKIRCVSNDGVCSVGDSSRSPNLKSLYFTPRHGGVALLTSYFDNQVFNTTIMVNETPSYRKVIWTAGGVAVVITAVVIYKVVLDKLGVDDDYVYFDSIESAISNAEDGTAIIIPPGIYRGNKSVGLNINKNIFLISDSNQTGDSIIDGEGISQIWNISSSNITILGLTFINGYSDGDGGALKFNTALDNSTIIAKFINNKAANGGAICFESAGGNVSYSEFTSNQATYDGGAVYFSNGGVLENASFVFNKADRGGGIFQIGDLKKENVSFNGNSAREGTNSYLMNGTADPNLRFNIIGLPRGETAFAELYANESCSGTVLLEINNVYYPVTIVNGYGNSTIYLKPGKYNATAIFRGDEIFKNSRASCEFEVYTKNLTDPNLSISVENVFADQEILIEINANNTFSANVSLIIDFDFGHVYTVNVVNGYGTISIGSLDVGNHSAVAYWEETWDFDSGSSTADFEVYPKSSIDPNLSVSVDNVTVGESVFVKVYVNETFSGDVSLMINNSDSIYSVAIVDGFGEFEISVLPKGSYMATVVFNETDVFKNSTATAEFEVYPMGLVDPDLSVSVANVTVGESVLLEISTNESFSGFVSVEVNGYPIPDVEIAGGYGSVVLDDLNVGNYTVAVVFNETDIFRRSVVAAEFEVCPKDLIDPDLSIAIANISFGEQLIVELGTNNTFSGNVTFKFNGSEESYHVNIIEGIGKFALDSLSSGRYIAFAVFHHTDVFKRSIKWTKFEVYPAKASLSAIVDDVVAGESSNVQIRLLDENGNPMDGLVTVSINGDDTNVTVTGGKATVPVVPAADIGACPITITYLGDENHNSSVLNLIIVVYGPGNVTVKHSDAGDAADIQAAIDSANPGDTIRLGNYNYTGVADVNITESVVIAGTIGTSISSTGDGTPIFYLIAISKEGPENLTITGVDFKLANGDIVVKAAADNNTENPLSIVTPTISISGNRFDLVNDTTVPESVSILELRSERGILSPTGEIAITGNIIDAGIETFNFVVTSAVSGNDAYIGPQNLTHERKATIIEYNDLNTTAVSPLDPKTGEWFVWRLVDGDGNPIANTPMKIGFNGVIYDEKNGMVTDENGYAKLQINLGYKGDYTFAISFLGNDDYNASFVVAKIKVATQTGSLTVPNKSYKATAKTKSLTATFKTKSGKAIANKKISFTVNGKTYSAKTNNNGVATVNVSLNKKGTYSFIAKFVGDSTYTEIRKTAKLTVK